ncbi:MAG TPA: hypothetical protein VGM09_02120, partial [Bradyrhizobium sp.]
LSASTQKATGITDDLTKQTAILTAQIAAEKKTIDDTMAAIYALPVLQRQKQFLDGQLTVTQGLANTVRNNPGASSFDGTTGAGELGDGSFITAAMNANQPAATAPAAVPTAVTASYTAATQAINGTNAASLELTSTTSKLSGAQSAADDAAAALAQLEGTGTASADALTAAHHSYGDALQALAAQEKDHIAALNGSATGADILKQKTDALTAAFNLGKDSATDYNQALHGDTANLLASLQDQLAITQAVTVEQKQQAQYQADINTQLQLGKNIYDATAIAAAKLAIAQAAARAATEKQATAGTAVSSAASSTSSAVGSTAVSAAAAAQATNQLASASLAAVTSANQMADAEEAAAQALVAAANAVGDISGGEFSGANDQFGLAPTTNSGSQTNGVGTGDTFTSGGSPSLGYIPGQGYVTIDQYNQYYSPAAQYQRTADAAVGTGDISGAISQVEGGQLSSFVNPSNGLFMAPSNDNSAQMSLVDTLTQIKNGQTSDPNAQKANLQSELSWVQSLPETIERDQKIVSLNQSITSLDSSVTANTAALTSSSGSKQVIIYVQPGVTADQFTQSRAQIQRVVGK